MLNKKDITKINEYLWEIPKEHWDKMNVPARIYADEKLLEKAFEDRSIGQLINVSTLPGIQKYALAMPDIHEGYGFPIGGVAAFDMDEGIISPGGVGYDINCGVRLLRSQVQCEDVKDYILPLMNQLQRDVPSGLGSRHEKKLSDSELNKILDRGAQELVRHGAGDEEDIEHCEEKGSMKNADHNCVSERAKNRGRDELGTLGSGNHFLELQRVEKIFDEEAAETFGIFEGKITVMIHCGSRGLGHQVATDYIRELLRYAQKNGIWLADRELVWAKLDSDEGRNYFSAMCSAANFAWANRHMIAHMVRGAWKRILGNLGGNLELVYDVAHNIAKIEEHEINPEADASRRYGASGETKKVCIHRKGATRAFGPGRKELHEDYRHIGQPVIIPGTMGTASYILVGTSEGMKQSFGSVCHGAGRTMSRKKAKRMVDIGELRREFEKKGIILRVASRGELGEEAPIAYKDIDNVVNVVHGAGLARKVARLKPLGVVKG
ncbi:MAG: RtcB family protein [Patescibacteria group bacterium]|nr:RtcB family protein [Patescibacteria group bacterium]